MQFWKMNGAGNDFIILNNLEERLPPSAFPLLARTLCTPHRSLGADGLMVVEQAQEGADFKMLFFNSDGSLGEMCGNGARCICPSQAGVVALDKHVAYCASKGAVIAMTKVMAYEWGRYGIRVNAVSPTVVLTELGHKAWDGPAGDAFKKEMPSERFAEPDEVAGAIGFLCSGAAAMITGHNLLIDGGYTIK